MSNGEMLEVIRQILKEEQPVPAEVSLRLIVAGLVEVYRKLNKVEDFTKAINNRTIAVEDSTKSIDARLVKVESSISKNGQKKIEDTKVSYLKWAIEKAAVPVLLVVIVALLTFIFGGN